jgi:phosphoribosylaminoimidazole-succinocarboxamide synthase
MGGSVLLESTLNSLPVKRGKVRDMYDLGDRMLMVATDRISAFDYVLPTGIPDKGRVLTQISAHWFARLGHAHHLLSTDLSQMDLPPDADHDPLQGRTMLVRKTEVVPIECVVRGYLVGSGWKEYQRHGAVCGIELPDGLTESARFESPIFTPAIKAESGHDENISFAQMIDIVGQDVAQRLRAQSLQIYLAGAEESLKQGIIIADTKFEWGFDGGELLLIDEVMTPDSSRFWPANQYQAGRGQSSFDKQFVRDWLEATDWDKNSPPPPLPDEIVWKTRQKYIEAFERITNSPFAWK